MPDALHPTSKTKSTSQVFRLHTIHTTGPQYLKLPNMYLNELPDTMLDPYHTTPSSMPAPWDRFDLEDNISVPITQRSSLPEGRLSPPPTVQEQEDRIKWNAVTSRNYEQEAYLDALGIPRPRSTDDSFSRRSWSQSPPDGDAARFIATALSSPPTSIDNSLVRYHKTFPPILPSPPQLPLPRICRLNNFPRAPYQHKPVHVHKSCFPRVCKESYRTRFPPLPPNPSPSPVPLVRTRRQVGDDFVAHVSTQVYKTWRLTFITAHPSSALLKKQKTGTGITLPKAPITAQSRPQKIFNTLRFGLQSPTKSRVQKIFNFLHFGIHPPREEYNVITDASYFSPPGLMPPEFGVDWRNEESLYSVLLQEYPLHYIMGMLQQTGWQRIWFTLAFEMLGEVGVGEWDEEWDEEWWAWLDWWVCVEWWNVNGWNYGWWF